MFIFILFDLLGLKYKYTMYIVYNVEVCVFTSKDDDKLHEAVISQFKTIGRIRKYIVVCNFIFFVLGLSVLLILRAISVGTDTSSWQGHPS